jgi:hypothetical protein
MGVSGQCHAAAALNPQGKDPHYPLGRRLGGPQSRSGHRLQEKSFCLCRESSPDRPVNQSVVRHYTGWAMLAPKSFVSSDFPLALPERERERGRERGNEKGRAVCSKYYHESPLHKSASLVFDVHESGLDVLSLCGARILNRRVQKHDKTCRCQWRSSFLTSEVRWQSKSLP